MRGLNLELGKYLNMLWSTFYAIGQIFIVAIGLILKNNRTIWSRWLTQIFLKYPFHPQKVPKRKAVNGLILGV